MRPHLSTLAVLLLLAPACSHASNATPDSLALAQAESRAIEFVKQRIGVEVYERAVEVTSVSPLPSFSDRYLVRFSFVPPEAEWAVIEFCIHVKEGSPCVVVLNGVPNCAANPQNCCVAVPQEQALATVRMSGLESCTGEWFARLNTHPDFECIVWEVIENVGEFCLAQSVYIDACTGEVLGRNFEKE